jgi:hypothetical protein
MSFGKFAPAALPRRRLYWALAERPDDLCIHSFEVAIQHKLRDRIKAHGGNAFPIKRNYRKASQRDHRRSPRAEPSPGLG